MRPRKYAAVSMADGSSRRVLIQARRGAWILHRSVGCDKWRGRFSVTHRPSGIACATGLLLATARSVLRGFSELKGDWSFVTKDGMSTRQKIAGQRILERLGVKK